MAASAYRDDMSDAAMSDAARTLFLVCYDVSETKRREQVRRYLVGYRIGGQKSFFECSSAG